MGFLEDWALLGGGFVVLTSIVPDGQTTTRTFGLPGESTQMADWVAARDGRENLYLMVNSARGRLTKKASKNDISRVVALHVDLDAAPGETQEAAIKRTREALESYVPPPSVIVFSGGGHQAYWLLEEPIEVRDLAHVAELEAYNRALESALGGDHCHNIDRIMRVPLTINVPNKKKRDRGRLPVRSTVVKADWSLRYKLEDMRRADVVQVRAASAEPVGNLAPVDPSKLPVNDRVRAVIVHGDDPDQPFKSRSEAVWYVLCQMAKAGCDEADMLSVLLDRDLGVSGHIYGQRRPEHYARRQITRAVEAAVAPELAELNESNAVVKEGGRVRIYTLQEDDLAGGRSFWAAMPVEDFKAWLMNRFVQVGVSKTGTPVYVPLAKWWLEHPRRTQYAGIVFNPGMEVPSKLNLWRGFSCDPKAGDWSLLRSHMLDNLCRGDSRSFDYLLKWCARAVQRPGDPGQVAVVLRGKRGTGKTVFAKHLGSLFGHHYMSVSNAKHLTGNFNVHLRDCVLLFADEAFWAGDKQGESTLKTLITEDTLPIEAKGRDIVVARNCVHLVMASNHDWVVPAGPDERRYFVLDVSDERAKDVEYFAAIEAQMSSGGREAMLYHLLHEVDLSSFEVRLVQNTTALLDQKVMSLTPELRWWLSKLERGVILRGDEEWKKVVATDEAHDDYVMEMQKLGVMRRSSSVELGMLLRKVLPMGFPMKKRAQVTKKVLDDRTGDLIERRRTTSVYMLPDLETCRNYWDGNVVEARSDWQRDTI